MQPLCLSGDTTVNSLHRGTIPLSTVQLGEPIFVGNGKYEPVYSFGHFGPDVRSAKMLKILTNSGTTFTISDNHLVFTENNKAIPAAKLTVGSSLQSSSSSIDSRQSAASSTVKHIKSIQRIVSDEGVYAPFTASGRFVVGGDVVVSCYVAMLEGGNKKIWLLSHHLLAHTFTFPRRLVCLYLTKCHEEEYAIDSGIALWIAPYFNWIRCLINHSSSSTINPIFILMPFLFGSTIILAMERMMLPISAMIGIVAVKFYCRGCKQIM